MKGKEIITYAVRAEMPDMEQMKNNITKQTVERKSIKSNMWVKQLIPVAVCLAIILVSVIAFPNLVNNTDLQLTTKSGKTEKSPSDDLSMSGLPVENFNLADLEIPPTLSRIAYTNFGKFFEFNEVNAFVVVKITDTKILEAEYETERINKFGKDIDIQREILPKRQISEVKILQNIYGNSEFDKLQITQWVFDNNPVIGGVTNLLRKGGVYLLPLSQNENGWVVMGDMDVLFEIDDMGEVWSHSEFEDFNRHDGKNIEFLINELQDMLSNDDFMLARSSHE